MTKSALSKAYEQFRVLLIEARRTSGLTQEDLARLLDKPQSFISKYERGERRLDIIEFLQVAKALGMNASEVVQQLERGSVNETKHTRKVANHRT